MAVADYRRELSGLKPGTHLLGLFASEAEQRAWVIPYLIAGLEAGEQVVYIWDSRPPEVIQEHLRAAGVDLEPYLASGQLSFLAARETLINGGCFDPELAVHRLERETAEARAHGYTGLRVTAEMSWALASEPGCPRFVEFECKCNALLPGTACLALCQYDLQRFTPQQLLEVLAVHPQVISAEGRHENLYYLEPSHMGAADPASALLHGRLGRMHALSGERRRHQHERERVRETLDAVSVPVVALDAQGRVTFMNEAGELTFGRLREEAEGQPAWELLVELDCGEEFRRLFREAWVQGEAAGRMRCQTLDHGAPRELEVLLRRSGDTAETRQVILTVAS